MKYIKLFENHSQYEDFTETEDFVKPNVSRCIQGKDMHYNPVDYSEKYLTYKILNDNTNVQITISSDFDTTAINYISYSTDNGNSWTTINNEDNKSSDLTYSFIANRGDYIMWRAEAETLSIYDSSEIGGYINGCKIQCDDEYNVFGNIMSLLYGDSFYEEYSLVDRDYCFAGLFKNEPIVSAEKFILPATTLVDSCYKHMFYGCTNLTNVPELPATTLVQHCYYGMFYNCISLVTPPELPATTLANYCYYNMFQGCTSLTTAPQLSATTLANYCYSYMFSGCKNLVVAPKLPATTLADDCYNNMFRGCTSLTITPKLPATTLVNHCYSSMFWDCISLTTAPKLPATTLGYGCYQDMFLGCTNLISPPKLPATTLVQRCYDNMFYGTNVLPDTSNIDFTSEQVVASGGLIGLFAGTNVTDNDLMRILPKNNNGKYCLPVTTLADSCYNSMFAYCSSLTTAPELPATTLADSCYLYMFQGCTSLTVAPELPATTLANFCYQYMFASCKNLTVAPELPVSTLKQHCYVGMFQNCISLTRAPELPATTLAFTCYDYMFYGCTNLNYIKAMFTTTPSTTYTLNWVSGVASTGTFVKNSAATWDVTGSSGIPTGWTIQTVNE